MSLVKAWYSNPENLGRTDPKGKEFDWSLFPADNPVPVLEIGAGCDSVHCLSRPWVTVDFAAPALALSLGKCVVADARALPFQAGVFGLALDLSTGDHIERGRKSMRSETFRVLRPGGYYVVTYPNAWHCAYAPDAFGYTHCFTPSEMEDEVFSAGFVIEAHIYTHARSGLRARKRA